MTDPERDPNNEHVDKQWIDFADKADRFLKDNSLGIDIKIQDSVVLNVQEVINMSTEDIYALDEKESNIYSMNILQYSMYLRSILNRLTNIIDFCNFSINQILSRDWNSPELEYVPKEMKPHRISQSNKIMERLMKVRLISESRKQGMSENLELLRSISYRLGR